MAVIAEELQELEARLRAVARPEEDADTLLKLAVQEFIARRAAESARWEAARAEAQTILNGPRHRYEPYAAYQRDREKYGWTEDLSSLSREELADRAEATLAELPPEKIAEAERLGFL